MVGKIYHWIGLASLALVLLSSFSASLWAANLADGLTFYLPFDGDANAFVARGNPMEMGGGIGVVFVKGKIGQAAYCGHRGKNRYLSYLTTSPNFSPNIFAQQGTIAFWVCTDWDGNEPSERYCHFLSIRSGLFYLYWHRGALTFSSTIRSQARHHYAPTVPISNWKAGEWHHVAITWQRDAKTLKGFKRIFVDGKLEGEAKDVLLDLELTGALIIGGIDGSETFERIADASIDEFAVWERALSQGEIDQLMSLGKRGQSLASLPEVQKLAQETQRRIRKPLLPQKGNLLPNASFEVGTHPYRASNMSLRLNETTKVHGNFSACLDISHWTGTTIFASGLFVARQQVEHTFSVWLKSERRGVQARFGVYSAYVGGSQPYEPIFYGIEDEAELSTKWQRYSVTGKLPPSPNNFYFVRIAFKSSQPTKVWLDAMQLEEGKKATPFQPSSPIEVGLTTTKLFHLFHPDEAVRVQLSVFNESEAAKTVPLTVTVCDLWERVVARRRIQVQAKRLKKELKFMLPLGSYRVSVADAKGKILDEQVIAVLPKFDEGFESMGIHVAANETGAVLARALGCRWVRILDACAVTHWDIVEPKEGQWAFERENWIDGAIDTYRKAGLKILGLLFGTPTWASSGGSVNHPPKDLEKWREYVRRVAKHFKGRINAWEVWNEPYGLGLFEGKEELYLQMVKIAAEEIKAVDPQAQIVAPCTYWRLENIVAWTERLIGLGLLNFADVFSFHGYEGYRPLDFEKVKAWSCADGKLRPVWNTEQGLISQSFYRFLPDAYDDPYTRWIAGSKAPTAKEAAALLVKAYVSSLAAGCEKFFQYWAVPEEGLLPRLKSMSLLEFDNALRPKAVAWAIVGWILDGSKVEKVERRGNLWELHFGKGDITVTVIWNEGEPVSMNVSRGIKALTMMGTPIEGKKVVVGDEPVYLMRLRKRCGWICPKNFRLTAFQRPPHRDNFAAEGVLKSDEGGHT